MKVTKDLLKSVARENVRNNQIGGETDGWGWSVAEEAGFTRPGEVTKFLDQPALPVMTKPTRRPKEYRRIAKATIEIGQAGVANSRAALEKARAKTEVTDGPATSLAEYYGSLASVLSSITKARQSQGFDRLRQSDGAQALLNEQHAKERQALLDYAAATGAYDTESVDQAIGLPANFGQVELAYFGANELAASSLEARRQQVQDLATQHNQQRPGQVA